MATKEIRAKLFKWRHFEPELILWGDGIANLL